MKILGKHCVLVALMILTFSHCKKEETVYQAYFYTLESPDEARLFLFVNGQAKGELPFIRHYAGFTADSIKLNSLKLTLSSGKHKLEAKDQNGQIRSSGRIRLANNKLSSSGGAGGQEFIMENNEMRMGFSF